MSQDRRFDEIFLHIGLGKTGSSSLQAFLQANAASLARDHDTLYPDFSAVEPGFDGNHSRYLQLLCAPEEHLEHVYTLRGRDSDAERREYREQTHRAWEAALAQSRASRLLLSAESLGHNRRPVIEALRDRLAALSDRVTVIACVRHPYSALASEIQQRVKAGMTLEELYADPPYYALQPLLRRFADLFGAGNMRLYDFEQARAHPGGLEQAFMDTVGISLPGSAAPEAQNPSMSMKATLLLSSLNRQQPLVLGDRRNPRRSHDLQGRMSAIPGERYAAPRQVYERLAIAIAPHLRWLRKHFDFEPTMGNVRYAPDDMPWHSPALDREARWRARYWRIRGRLVGALKGRPVE